MAASKRIGRTLDLAYRLQKCQNGQREIFQEHLGPTDTQAAEDALKTIIALYEELHMATSLSEEGGY